MFLCFLASLHGLLIDASSLASHIDRNASWTCFCFACTAMNVKATLISPQGMIATTVGVTQAIYWGLGKKDFSK